MDLAWLSPGEDKLLEIVTTVQHQVLGFINACNRSGYRPTAGETKLWLDEPTPKSTSRITQLGALTGLEGLSKMIQFQLYGTRETTTEHPVDHLLRIGWIEADNDRLRLTRLGDALLADTERLGDADERGAAVVVLETADRFAYARLIGEIARLGEAYLVDPYFRLPQLEIVLQSTRVRRILISKQYKASREARAELAVALATIKPPADIEIRATSSETLHDRVIVADNGEVFMLGASLGTIGIANTVFMKVPEPGARALKQQAEELWESSESVALALEATEEVDRS